MTDKEVPKPEGHGQKISHPHKSGAHFAFDWRSVRKVLRNRDVRGILLILFAACAVGVLWDLSVAQSVSDIIESLATATPETRTLILNMLGQCALIIFFGIAIVQRLVTAATRPRSA